MIVEDSKEGEELRVVDEVPEGLDRKRVIDEREVEDFRIVWRLMSGTEILEGPEEIPSRLWPIVPVWGKEVKLYSVSSENLPL